MDKFSIKRNSNDASAIWTDVIDVSKDAASLLRERLLLVEPNWLVRSTTADFALPRPSDMLIFFAVKQLLVESRFSSLSKDSEISIRAFNNQLRERLEQSATGPGAARTFATLNDLHRRAVVTNWSTTKVVVLATQAFRHHSDEIRRALTGTVNKWRGSGADRLMPADIFENPVVSGPTAILALREIITNGVKPHKPSLKAKALAVELDNPGWLHDPDAFDGQRFEFAISPQKDLRTEALADICDAIFGENDLQMVNCFAPGMRGALTALATELFSERHRQERDSALPMLYVALHGRSLSEPEDSFAELTYAVWRFYSRIHEHSQHGARGDGLARLDLPRPKGLDATVEMIRATRILMAAHPAVVVFDGFRAGRFTLDRREYSLHNLVSAVAGDRLLDLIERLTMIPTPGDDGAIDVTAFRQNRFVVLSDHRLFQESDVEGRHAAQHPHPALQLINGRSFEIQPPRKSELGRIIGSFGNQAPRQISWIQANIAGVEPESYELLQAKFEAHTQSLLDRMQGPLFRNLTVLESIVGVLSTLEVCSPGRRLSTRVAQNGDAALEALIEQDLMPVLSSQAVDGSWLALLHFIAIAPGGLRPKTLARAYEHLLEAEGHSNARALRHKINAKIAAMLQACHGVVNIGRSDHLEALRGRPLPLLFRQQFILDELEIPTDRAIDFICDEVRDEVLRNAEDRDEGQYVAFLHFILAEEAYEQAVHLARYDDLQGEDSLHRNARLLTAIFHGTASLGTSSLDLQLPYRGAGRFLPDDPHDRWIKLYSFAYRRNLDRPPLHQMVRAYDAAQTKLDLLLALARPQLCRRTERPPPKWKLPDLTSDTGQLPAGATPLDERRHVLRDFALELRRSANAVSRYLDVDWDEAGLTGERHDEIILELGEDILRLTGDASLRDAAVEALSERILAQIQSIFKNHHTDQYLRFVQKHVRSILNGVERSELIAPKLASKIFDMALVPARDQRLLANYLHLYGEVLGLKADRDHGDPALRTRHASEENVISGFVESFAAYYVAEYLRNQIFWNAPNKTHDVVNGRASRGFIRVALKLERFRASNQRAAGRAVKPGGWFWRHAHDTADELARHLSRFPRERVAMLTLDATMARYYESRNSPEYAHYLEMARESLYSAEPLLLKLGLHNRLQQRFSLERTKVLTELARLAIAEDDLDAAHRYLLTCENDIDKFRSISTDGNVVWANLAIVQDTKVAEQRLALSAAVRSPGGAVGV